MIAGGQIAVTMGRRNTTFVCSSHIRRANSCDKSLITRRGFFALPDLRFFLFFFPFGFFFCPLFGIRTSFAPISDLRVPVIVVYRSSMRYEKWATR